MKILLDNVTLGYNSGPNNFALKVKKYFEKMGHTPVIDPEDNFDVKLSFIQERFIGGHSPLVQRLDGIYFDVDKDNSFFNKAIRETYKKADGVIFQSEFSKKLVFKYFGSVENYTIINNGADLDFMETVPTVKIRGLHLDSKVWCCASHWRGWKRMHDNIRYFLEFSGEKDVLLVAGDPIKEEIVEHKRIKYLGNIKTETLFTFLKTADYFIHLARYDSCPNVVVDARAAGCHIVCCSNGGTREIAGSNATVVVEEPWDFELVDVNRPPGLSFDHIITNDIDSNIDMNSVAAAYVDFLQNFERKK
jgi:glycosyltransferase involved in cell wall biosynthesis